MASCSASKVSWGVSPIGTHLQGGHIGGMHAILYKCDESEIQDDFAFFDGYVVIHDNQSMDVEKAQ